MTKKKLIVVADDLGASESVNDGIIASFSEGIVTASSLLVGMPNTDDGVKKAKQVNLPMGLHLRLTEGIPLTKGPIEVGLCDRGEFLPPKKFFFRLLKGGRQLVKAIQGEIHAQMNEFLMITSKPDHLNTHHHTHLSPIVLDQILYAAKDLGFPALRWPVESYFEFGSAVRNAEVMAFNLLAYLGQNKINNSGIITTDHFMGIRLMDGRLTISALYDKIVRLPLGVTELMVHPRLCSDATADGVIEAKTLCNHKLKDILNKNKIHLTSFRKAYNI